MRSGALLILSLGLLGACTRVTVFGHTVKEESAPARAPQPAAQPGKSPITRLALELTPAAQQQVAADERFNAEDLREAVAAELRSRQMLDLQSPGAGRVAEIRLEEFTIRATSNVVLFGRLPSSGVLAGTVRMREAAGGEASEFPVRAEIPLSISKNGTDKHPLQNLYSGFARQLVDEITGAPPRLLPRQ